MKNINLLKNAHKNNDIYIICSGASVNNFPKNFFKNKITISLNRMFYYFNCNYIICKELDNNTFKNIKKNSTKKKVKLIMSENLYGDPENRKYNIFDYKYFYFFKNLSKSRNRQKPNFKALKNTQYLINSYSTISSALHLAAHLGAKNIFVIGHDCCKYEGEYYIKNYYKNYNSEKYILNKKKFFKTVSNHSQKVTEKIKKKYKCNIFSIYQGSNFLEIQKKFEKNCFLF